MNRDEVLKLCNLSRIEFTDDELPKVISDLDSIIKFSSSISDFDCPDLHNDCSTLNKNCYSQCQYPSCTQSDIVSGGNNKNGFFFVKRSF